MIITEEQMQSCLHCLLCLSHKHVYNHSLVMQQSCKVIWNKLFSFLLASQLKPFFSFREIYVSNKLLRYFYNYKHDSEGESVLLSKLYFIVMIPLHLT